MSRSMENKSQISSSKIEVDREDPALHIQLASIFTKVVSEKTSTMLEAPQQEQSKQEDLVNNAAATSESITKVAAREDLAAARKSAYKGKNLIVGQLTDVTFEVPEDCIAAKIDMDKIAEINPNCRSSFAKRLQGWHIERRQRLKNTSGPRNDWSFRHSSSRKEFRSVVEVVDYILYEIYPRKKYVQMKPDKDVIIEDVLAANPKGQSSSVCDKREKAQRHKEFVEEFLKESWLNLMNSKETEKSSYADADDESGESETAEEMVEAFYNEIKEHDEEFSYTDADDDDDDDDDESIETETDEEMIEAVLNDTMDYVPKINRVKKDNDGKRKAPAADPEQVQGTPSETQASNKNM